MPAQVELNEGEDEMVPEQNEPIVVELGDVQAVKTALDDSLCQVITHTREDGT